MARDYANKKTGRPKGRKPQQNQYGALLLVLLVLGILVYLHQTGALSQLTQKLTAPLHSPTAANANHHHVTIQQPHFEFYTVLPKNGPHISSQARSAAVAAVTPVAVAAKPHVTATPTAAVIAHVPPNKTVPVKPLGSYLLQVASYRTMGEADNLKAKLVFLGYDVSVVNFNNRGATWYRVRVGPYPSMIQAQSVQASLLKHRYHTIVQRAG